MSIRAITFNKMTCKSEDDALIYDTFLNHINGRVRGVNLTYDTNNLFLSVGYFMAQGRLVNIFGAHTIPIPAVETGEQYVQVVYEIDLSKTNTATDFQQGAFKLLTSFDGWQSYTQEDLFSGGYVYQIPFARMKNNINGVHSFEAQLDSIDIPTLYNQLSIENQEYRSQFDIFYNEQKTVILDMIRQLSEQGYVTVKDFNTAVNEIASSTQSYTDDMVARKADKNHTHNYAGSSSVGGSATTALACTGNAATATKATQDSDGNNIKNTYATKAQIQTLTSTKIDKSNIAHNVEIVDPNKVVGADVFNSEITRLNSDLAFCKNRFNVIQGISNSGATYINYPTGFTYQNTVVLSGMSQYSGSDYYVLCDADRLSINTEPTRIRMNAAGNYINQKYKITIMRTD